MSCYNLQNVVKKIEKCVAFENNNCIDSNCSFLHKYKFCFNYQNTICRNDKCPFLHCTVLEQFHYENTGRKTENLKEEVGRTLQSSSICGEFKNDICTRTKCNLRHIKLNNSTLECPICTEIITIESLGAGECGHVVCLNCALRCLDDTYEQSCLKMICPICRRKTLYNKMS